jgi:uncharacterized protein (TIGR03118 family)
MAEGLLFMPSTYSRAVGSIALVISAALPAMASSVYVQQNLVSDIPGFANSTDPDLVNPWGLSSSSTSPWWVNDNGMGLATLYNGSGVKQGLVVTIPTPMDGTPPSAPSGQVFNNTTSFALPGGSPSLFVFATEDGTISAWNGAQGTTAVLEADNSASGAVYKGLAIGNNGTGDFIYAANFNAGTIDVFDGNFNPTTLPGTFTDPNLPAGYAPFNVANLSGKLYVTYALQNDAKHDDVAAPGNGYVDVYDLNGNLLGRIISNGPLNSPWGLAVAPSLFGSFSNDLLVGNFGDGMINAFDPSTGAFLGGLMDASGNPIQIEGLWGLAFGNGANAGPNTTLFFTAGIGNGDPVESHGLFGDISAAAPEPSTLWLLGCATILFTLSRILKPTRRS